MPKFVHKNCAKFLKIYIGFTLGEKLGFDFMNFVMEIRFMNKAG